MTNQILLELVRQMHSLRMEALAAHRVAMLVSAAETQRELALQAATQQTLKPIRVGSSANYESYSVTGRRAGAFGVTGPVTAGTGPAKSVPSGGSGDGVASAASATAAANAAESPRSIPNTRAGADDDLVDDGVEL
jgi:hypothetical protein